jgi:protein O-mannosyl-transferase
MSPTAQRRDEFGAAVVIFLAVIIGYHGSFSVPFFFDDVAAIAKNPTIRNLWRLDEVLSPPADGGGMTGRPVVNLSLAINYAISGSNVWSYHVFNFVVHTIAAFALFGVVRRTLVRPVLQGKFAAVASSLALTIALLWAVHPLQTESVTCVIQRTEALVGMWYLLTLYCFIRSADDARSRWWGNLAIACCALGMATKEVMVTAPLIVLLYDRTFVAGTFRAAWQQRGRLHASLLATEIILVALLVKLGGTRGVAAGFGLGVSWWSYALKQCEAIVTYLKLAVWPFPLIMDYGTDVVTRAGAVAPQIAFIVFLVALTVVALRRWPMMGFALFSFLAILAPSSSVVPLVSQTVAEHRMYLPLAAVISLLVIGGYNLGGLKVVKIGALIAAAWCTATIARNRTMQDEVRLWSDTVAKIPTNPRAHGSLGLALSERARRRDALPHFTKALELDPKSVATEQNIGNVYYQLRDFTAAAAHYRRAIELDPKFASGYNNLGAALLELRDVDGALAAYRAAIRIDPDHLGAHQNAARALFASGRFNESVAHYEHVLRLRPTSAEAHYDLGLALAQAGNMHRAKEQFAAALRLKPSARSYLNYARFLIKAGHHAEAVSALESALRLQPDFAEARQQLEQLRGSNP